MRIVVMGAVARMAAAAGIPAPVNSTLYATLKPHCDGASRLPFPDR